MVGLLLGDVVSTKKHPSLQRMWVACFLKKQHIVTKDVVGLQVRDIVVRMIN